MKSQRVADRHPGGEDRNRDLALIHMAKSRLQMAEDIYRDLVRGVSNQRASSAADLTQPERHQLLDHMKRCGFGKQGGERYPDTPEWGRAWSLWQQLADAGKVENRDRAAFINFAKNTANVDRANWLTPKHASVVIEALKAWLNR